MSITRPRLLTLLCVCCACLAASADEYDPSQVASDAKTKDIELTFNDDARDRELPLKIYLPEDDAPAPVILFSHGLGGSRSGCAYLGQHWSKRGYVAVFLQHPGSDDSVWKDEPRLKRMTVMQQAASAKNYLLRVKDVPAVLNQLERWNQQQDHQLHQRLNLEQVGMSGHSFGALTTQSVSGQSAGRIGTRYTDKRIKAALALSPSSPRRGDKAAAFASVKIPWMLMTGTDDTSPIGNADVESRRAVFPNLPTTIDKYELVFHKGEHSAFSDRALPGDRQKRNPNHHRAILALSTAFWDAHLKSEPKARDWLHGEPARRVLESQDRWQLNVARQSASESD